jgi:rhomboid protease GluP
MESRRMCPHCRAFITTSDRVCPYCNEAVGPRAIDRREPGAVLGGLIPQARFNTILILLMNVGLYVITSLYSMNAGAGGAWNIDARTLVEFGAKYGPLIELGQWWRLVTAGFLHGGLLHILMNSWVLFDLSAQVEEVYGAARMWVIYFISSVFGFYVSTVWNPMIPSVGASAALFGLIGAMIALGVRHRNALGAAVRGIYVRWAIYGLIFSLFGNIDMAAHIGGLVAGFGVGYLAGARYYEGSITDRGASLPRAPPRGRTASYPAFASPAPSPSCAWNRTLTVLETPGSSMVTP